MEEIDKNADPESYGFNVTSVDDGKADNIVGHGSFEYNKAMLKECPHFSKKSIGYGF